MRQILFWASALFLLVLVSCSKESDTKRLNPIVQEARIKTIHKASIDDYYVAVGTVRARTRSVIAARIMGNILRLTVREGDKVRAGQTLIEIENRDASIQQQKAEASLNEAQSVLEEVQRNIRAGESALAAARANERLASTTFERFKTLHERRSVSTQEFEEARAKYEVAGAERERTERILDAGRSKRNQSLARIEQSKAELANARVHAGYARVQSPLDGVVVAKHADIGSLATPGIPLLTIESSSSYQLEVPVQESQFGHISLGDKVLVQIEALHTAELPGIVSEIVPAAEAQSRSYIVRIDLTNLSGDALRSGLYGKVRFTVGQRDVLMVPSSALVQRGQLTSVFVVDQSGVAKLRLVKTGETNAESVEVLSGLNDGEQIITDGVMGITEGSRVRQTAAINDADRTSG